MADFLEVKAIAGWVFRPKLELHFSKGPVPAV
jgi:hypothetical protein